MKKFKLTENELTRIIKKVILSEDSNEDRPDNWKELPGYNPYYFYDDDSLISQMRKKEEGKLGKLKGDVEVEMSKEELNKALVEIYSLLQDNAPAIASRRLEGILYKLGAFK